MTREPKYSIDKKIVSSVNGAGKIGQYTQKNKTGIHLTSFIKINSKCIKHLNVKSETIKLLEEKLLHTSFGLIFLDITSKVLATKTKLDR